MINWGNNAFPSGSYQVRFWSDISDNINMAAMIERKDYLTGAAVNLDHYDKGYESLPFKATFMVAFLMGK